MIKDYVGLTSSAAVFFGDYLQVCVTDNIIFHVKQTCGEKICNFKIQKSSICSNRLRIFNFDNDLL